jgi:DNA-binding beta-propeller fold protein YncE
MTNLSGLGTGFVGSLGYWLSQHEVQRGSQPWYYYLLVFPLYEYLPLVTSMIAGGYFFIKRKTLSPQTRWLVPFLIVWGVGIWVALSIAGEKMPWLSTHIAVPFILLSGWWIGQLLSYGWDLSNATKVLGKAAALGLVTVLTLMTIRTSLLVNYVNYDYTTEFIGYAHGGPGVKDTVRDIDLIGRRTGLGRDLKIAYDDSVSWPMTWYLRDFQNQAFYGSQPNRQALDAPVVIAGPKNWSKVETILIDNYYRYDLIRIWWPIEDYKDLTLERVRYALSDSSMRAALWDIFWSRDYTHYAEITGQRLEPPMEWPLGERMRIYVRMDDVIQTDDFNMKTSRLEDLTKPLDAYSSISKPVLVKNLLYPDLNSPRGMALAPDGSIYIADTGNSRLVKLDSSGNFLKTMGGPTGEDAQSPTPGRFNEPWGVAVDRFGNIYIADTWNHRIQKFDAEGNLLTVWGEPGLPVDGQNHLWGPRGIAVSEDGRVYVTDTGNKRVVVFDSEGAFLFDFGKEGDGLLDEPVGLAFDSQGKIYVADTWKSRIAVFTLEGAFLTSWPVHGWRSISLDNKPYLAVDTQDRIYITDPEGYRVVVFNSTGEALAAYGQYGPEDDSFNLPVGLAVGTDGSLWITDAGSNRLGRYLLWQE